MTEREEQIHDPALSGFYRQATAGEPPAALDAAILAAARQAVQPVMVRSRPWWKRMTRPAALVATVVMAVMLSLTVDRQPKDIPPPPVLDEQAPAPVERREATKPVLAAKADAAFAKAKSDAPVAARQAAPAVAPLQLEKKEPSVRSQPAPAPPPMEVRDAMPERSNVTASGAVAPAPAAAPAMAEETRRDAPKAAPMATMRAAKSALPTPEAWAEEVRQLRRQGRNEEADRRLAELRKAYPDYLLPEDLRR